MISKPSSFPSLSRLRWRLRCALQRDSIKVVVDDIAVNASHEHLELKTGKERLNVVQKLIGAVSGAEPLNDVLPIHIFHSFKFVLVNRCRIVARDADEHDGIVVSVVSHFYIHVLSDLAGLKLFHRQASLGSR